MKKKINEAPDELFIVVNEQDNILEYLPRSVVHQDKNIIHRTVNIVVFNDKGEILLQKRSRYKDKFPLKYTLSASGHVFKGEEYEDAAKREMSEEIGINTELEFKKKIIKKDYYETEMVAIFIAKHNGPFRVDLKEVASTKFFTLEAIKMRLPEFSPAVRIILTELGFI